MFAMFASATTAVDWFPSPTRERLLSETGLPTRWHAGAAPVKGRQSISLWAFSLLPAFPSHRVDRIAPKAKRHENQQRDLILFPSDPDGRQALLSYFSSA